MGKGNKELNEKEGDHARAVENKIQDSRDDFDGKYKEKHLKEKEKLQAQRKELAESQKQRKSVSLDGSMKEDSHRTSQQEPVDLKMTQHSGLEIDKTRRELEDSIRRIEAEMNRFKERKQQSVVEIGVRDLNNTNRNSDGQFEMYNTIDYTGKSLDIGDTKQRQRRVSYEIGQTGRTSDKIHKENEFDFETEMQWIEKKAAEYDNSIALLSSTRRDEKDCFENEKRHINTKDTEETFSYLKQDEPDKRLIRDRLRVKNEKVHHDGYMECYGLRYTRETKDMAESFETESEDDQEETEIRKQIEKLQLMEKEAELRLKRKKMLKEMKRKEFEVDRLLKEKQEKRKLKEKRMKELREKERKLENSLHKMEETLKVIDGETSEEDNYVPDKTTANKDKRTAYRHSTILDDEDKVIDIVERQMTEREKVKSHIYKPTVPKLIESSFEEWKIEIEVMMKSGLYQEDILRQAVRNSLTGNTRKILLTLGTESTTREIVEKLQTVYGNVRSGESVLAEFYQAKQRKEESLSEWGIRLESMIQIALEKHQIHKSQKDEMLRSRFWRFLYNDELRNATRLGYETAKDFEDLQRKIRKEESEMNLTKETKVTDTLKQINSQQTSFKEQLSVLQDLVEKVKTVETKLEDITRERKAKDYQKSSDRQGYSDQYDYQDTWNQNRSRGRGRYRYRGSGYRGRGYRDESRRYTSRRDRDYDRNERENDRKDQPEKETKGNSSENRKENDANDKKSKKEEKNTNEPLN